MNIGLNKKLLKSYLRQFGLFCTTGSAAGIMITPEHRTFSLTLVFFIGVAISCLGMFTNNRFQ